jgi:hypothetical protein
VVDDREAASRDCCDWMSDFGLAFERIDDHDTLFILFLTKRCIRRRYLSRYLGREREKKL